MNDYGNWGSHEPVLKKVLELFPSSKFLELGSGYVSTPLIIDKTIFSIHLETNKDWYNEIKKFEKENHRIEFFDKYSLYEWDCDFFKEDWDIVFIDNAPGESRQSNLLKLKDKTKIIICHDTEASCYKWDFLMFKYVYTYKVGAYTTVCSNFYDLENFII